MIESTRGFSSRVRNSLPVFVCHRGFQRPVVDILMLICHLRIYFDDPPHDIRMRGRHLQLNPPSTDRSGVTLSSLPLKFSSQGSCYEYARATTTILQLQGNRRYSAFSMPVLSRIHLPNLISFEHIYIFSTISRSPTQIFMAVRFFRDGHGR